MEMITMKAPDISCEHCVATVKKTVGQFPGVQSVEADGLGEPLVFALFRDAARALRLVAAAMSSAEFNTARMAERASQGWITVTELADTLTRDHGVPFKAAYAIASGFVATASRDSSRSLSAIDAEVEECRGEWPLMRCGGIELGLEALEYCSLFMLARGSRGSSSWVGVVYDRSTLRKLVRGLMVRRRDRSGFTGSNWSLLPQCGRTNSP